MLASVYQLSAVKRRYMVTLKLSVDGGIKLVTAPRERERERKEENEISIHGQGETTG